MDRATRVLLIEDDADDYARTQSFLAAAEDRTYNLDWARTYEEGLQEAQRNAHDVVLVAHRLGERAGLDLVREAMRTGCRTPMIFLTRQRDRETVQAAMRAGVVDSLRKGRIDASSLERSIRYARERSRADDAVAGARAQEIEIGGRIQSTLLLTQPPEGLDGAKIGAVSLPSRDVDGDFWGFYQYDQQRFDLLVGDVMGKGVPAALIAAAGKSHFQDAIRRLVLELHPYGRAPEPEEIVSAVHHRMSKELVALDSFVTVCYARFDMASHRMKFVDAGHMRTVHYRAADGATRMLEGHNLPLGVRDTEMYAQSEVGFGDGDAFVFYSDGVTEARNARGELYGTERLVDLVTDRASQSAQELAEAVCDEAIRFAGEGGLSDDLTCLVVRIEETARPRLLDHAAMEVHTDPAELDAMRRLVDWFCRDRAVPPLADEETSALVLAVSEAASNVLSHAYWGARDRRLQVSAEAYEGEVHVEISDWGQPFDPAEVSQPSFDGSQERGFGVYIIAQSVDEFTYYRDDIGRNCLRLVKRARQDRQGES